MNPKKNIYIHKLDGKWMRESAGRETEHTDRDDILFIAFFIRSFFFSFRPFQH